MEPDTTWLSSPFLNKQRVTWRGTMETESSNTRQGVERGRAMLDECWHLNISKHPSKGQGCHRWVRTWVLWGPQTAIPDQTRVRPPIRWEEPASDAQNWDILLESCPLLYPLPTRDESQATKNFLMDHHWWWTSCDTWQVWNYEPQRKGIIANATCSASFLVTVCVQKLPCWSK